MEKNTIYDLKRILNDIQEQETSYLPIGFEYLVYEMRQNNMKIYV